MKKTAFRKRLESAPSTLAFVLIIIDGVCARGNVSPTAKNRWVADVMENSNVD